jgi:tetratricopeptide (TPR) repeat protein
VAVLGRRAPLPADAGKRQVVRAVDQELAPLRAQVNAARYQQAAPVAERLLAQARTTGYAPLVAELLSLDGRVEEGLEHSNQARTLYDESLLTAEAGGDDALRFEDEVRLFRLIGYLLERDADAQPYAARAEALLRRLGPGPRREAELAQARAVESWWSGRYVEAQQQAERAVARYERIDPKGVELAHALHTLGIVQQELRQAGPSVATLTRARAIAEAALGVQHPFVGHVLETLGGSLRRLGRWSEAQAALSQGLAILEATTSPGSSDIAGAHQNLANLCLDEKKYDAGIRELRLAADLFAQRLGPEHSRVGDVLETLGDAYRAANRPVEAEATLKRAIAIHRARLGPNNPVTATSVKRLGDLYLMKQPRKALKQYQEALRAMEASQGKTSALLAPSLAGVGDSWQELHQPVPERAAYERALKVIGNDKAQEALRLSLIRELAKIPKR